MFLSMLIFIEKFIYPGLGQKWAFFSFENRDLFIYRIQIYSTNIGRGEYT